MTDWADKKADELLMKEFPNIIPEVQGRLVETIAQALRQAHLQGLLDSQLHRNRLYEALKLFRSLVKEGGVPRYTINPGAALNMTLEETVDPLLRFYGNWPATTPPPTQE